MRLQISKDKPEQNMCMCKDCEIDDYLKNSTCVKSVIDHSVIMCDEIIYTPKAVSVNFID